MARLTLSKSSLARQRGSLKLYRRYLPSLDLKRRQLMAERAREAAALAETERLLELERRVPSERIPMLSNREVDLRNLARVARIEEDEENVVGTTLPRLNAIEIAVRPYSRLARPQWVDVTAASLRARLELEIRARFQRRRLALLEKAVRRVTQRVNLFEKVLIPRTVENIRKIQIYLGDAERAEVVRAKMAKKRTLSRSGP